MAKPGLYMLKYLPIKIFYQVFGSEIHWSKKKHLSLLQKQKLWNADEDTRYKINILIQVVLINQMFY